MQDDNGGGGGLHAHHPNEVNYQSIIKVINRHMIADSRMEEVFTAHSLPPNFDGQMVFLTPPQVMCISGDA